jgi:hypothetical protein
MAVKDHPLYIKWKNMRADRVPEWDSFALFVQAVSPTPSEAHYLCRVDRTAPYGPDNFLWLSPEEYRQGDSNPNFKDARTTTVCGFCGRAIVSFRSIVRKFCSRECCAASQTKPVVCKCCGDLFVPLASDDAFCSSACSQLHQIDREEAALLAAEKASSKKQYGVYTWALCKLCGKRMRLRPSDAAKGRAFCSRTCYGRSIGIRQTGDKHPLWKGGVALGNDKIRKSKLYAEWRDKVFARDEYTCQSCFDIGGDLQAHHLVAYKDEPRIRLKVRNGITLCKECHRKWHVFNRKGLFQGLERELQKRAIARFKEAGFFVFNVHGHALQMIGVSDVILSCFGLFAAVEFKVFPNFLTPMQKTQARAVKNSGGAAFMVRSEDDVDRVIDEMTRLALGEG